MPPFRKRCWLSSSLALIAWCTAFSLSAQVPSPLQPQSPAPGQSPAQSPEAQRTASVTISSFAGQLSPGLVPQTSGIRISTSTFIPGLGLLDGDLGGYSTSPGFRNSLSY